MKYIRTWRISPEYQNIHRNKVEILELKNTITEEVSRRYFKQNNAHKRRSVVKVGTRDNKLKLRKKKRQEIQGEKA